ncbi:DUF4038 domain-containing protein [Flavihumibacter fluvii]|uniref:apiosidase-like domain-containing protein n=1 Tax=Flavihumibacter fluvii TaxID=2838157 RepID=UPI001BDEB8A5|nr:DUF4038 domain-containing protein [Flavihumibacter fluvii]ULQ54129.1 DUF4038 domain-containing protein [Flavihumibacter fluvii]
MNKRMVLLVVIFSLILPVLKAEKIARQWSVFETSFETGKVYANPFTEIEVNVVFKKGTSQWVVPAFWAGGRRWTVRFAPPAIGDYRYHIECSDKLNTDLNGKEQALKVIPYKGDNQLLQHGFLTTSNNNRHFVHADGTPFFWLGDTWWKGLSKRISIEGFSKLADDRKAKGFTVVQIIAGPYPDEPPFDPRWSNEGGMPYDTGFLHINPAYFDQADRRIKLLVDKGIVPAILGGWGWHMPDIGVEKMNRHWRYLIARYGAYPAAWIVGGEAGGDEWTAVARYVRNTDPYRRLVTLHPYPGSGRSNLSDDTVLTFDMTQTGHGGFFGENSPYGAWQATAANTVSKVMSAYSKTPAMPVLVGEVTYEGHMLTNGAEVQRQVFWSSMLSGAAGHTYGAGGIWQMNSETERGAEYEFTTWYEAMKLPGATQLGIGRKLLEEYPWGNFQPHPEWVDPHSTTLFEPHADWYDDSKEYAARGNRWDFPYAAGIPGEVRIIYMPGHYYDWSAPAIKKLERDIPYQAFLVNPVNGKRYDLGIIINRGPSATPYKKQFTGWKYEPLVMHENPHILPAVIIPEVTILTGDEYKVPRLPAPQDWILVLERVK